MNKITIEYLQTIMTKDCVMDLVSVFLNQNYAGQLDNFMEANTMDEILFEIENNENMKN